MDTMQKIVLITHTLIAIGVIALVLLQRGKGADAGAGFGAGASGTVFGARGSASFFSRATAVLATAFFLSSLALAYLSSQRTDAPDSLLENAPAVEEEIVEAPADDAVPAVEDMPSIEPVEPSAEQEAMPSLDDGAEPQNESE